MVCSDYGGDWWKALEVYEFQDAALCGYQAQFGGPVFAAMILLGVINLPLYIKTDSVIMPVALTLVIGGLFATTVAGIVNGIMVAVLLLTFGLGPVLIIHKVIG